MHERINQLRLALTFSSLFTFGATFNQPAVEGCFDTDTINNTEFWVAKEEGIPKRIVPHPDSEEVGVWMRGKKVRSVCRRFFTFEVNDKTVSTAGYLVRSEEDESDLGWIIPNLDQPGLNPTSAGLPPKPDTVSPED